MGKRTHPRGIKQHFLDPKSKRPNYLQSFANGPLMGYVYFVLSSKMSVVKIGATNRWENDWPDAFSRPNEIVNNCPIVKFSGITVITPMALV